MGALGCKAGLERRTLGLRGVIAVLALALILGGPWVVISEGYKWGNPSYNPYQGLITLLITTHEPPSRVLARGTNALHGRRGLEPWPSIRKSQALKNPEPGP